jgi:hypothetical protein
LLAYHNEGGSCGDRELEEAMMEVVHDDEGQVETGKWRVYRSHFSQLLTDRMVAVGFVVAETQNAHEVQY